MLCNVTGYNAEGGTSIADGQRYRDGGDLAVNFGRPYTIGLPAIMLLGCVLGVAPITAAVVLAMALTQVLALALSLASRCIAVASRTSSRRVKVCWQALSVGRRRIAKRRTVDTGTRFILAAPRPGAAPRMPPCRVVAIRRGGKVVVTARASRPRRGPISPVLGAAMAVALITQPLLGAGVGVLTKGITSAEACSSAHGSLRVGEADTPGPFRALSYANPFGALFRGARIAVDSSNRSGCAADSPPDVEPFSLVVKSANTTGWGPLQRLLQSTDAHVICAQEHRLRGARVAEASEWAMRRGWKSLWSEATLTADGGHSGGVVIMARQELGMSYPPWGDPEVVKARAVAATVEAPGYRPTVIVSAYLHDGAGLTVANRAILARIGNKLQALGHQADQGTDRHCGPMPFLLAADFNLTPSTLAAADFAQRLGATVVAPRAARGTCRTARAHRTIDYFVMSGGMEQGIARVDTDERGLIKTHVPVRVEFRPRMTMLRGLAIRVPPKIPIERVYGPTRPLPRWDDVRQRTREAVRVAKQAAHAQAQEALDSAYEVWAQTAETELQELTGCELPKKGLRGRSPRLVWRTLLPERVGNGRGNDVANRARKRGALARDLRICCEDAAGGGPGAVGRVDGRIRDVLADLDDLGRQGGEAGDKAHDAILARLAGGIHEHAASALGSSEREWALLREELTAVSVELDAAVKKAEEQEKGEATAAWVDWVRDGVDAGAKNAHRATRIPQQWTPTTTADDDLGILTGDPMKLLAAQRREYAAQWRARDQGPRTWYSTSRRSLPRLSPTALREASLTMAPRTSQTYDGLHPRHFALLTDGALEALADLYEAAEALGAWPTQIALLTMPALPKPAGGYRLIGIFAATYRLWSRARRPIADRWEADNERPYLAAGTGRSAVDAVWRQSARAEAALAEEGTTAAAALVDLEKFYEHLDFDLLLDRATRLGLPEPLTRLALAAYSGPRMIRMRDFVAAELWADRGVVAGCSLATTFTRAYTIEAYDGFVARNPAVALDNYIDDNVLSAQGPREHVVRVLRRAAADLDRTVREELLCKVARRKTKIVAADAEVGRRLRDAAEAAIGGELAPSASDLGIDYAAGRRRRGHGAARSAAARLRQGMRRKARLRRITSAIGTSSTKVFTTGIMAGMVYGSEVHGLADAELLRIERLAATTMRPRARGRSLHVLMAINGAPTWRAGTAPILQYARAVWRAVDAVKHAEARADMTLPEIRRAGEALNREELIDERVSKNGRVTRRRRWDRVRGPMGALHLSLDRIGWQLVGQFAILDDVGVTRNITEHSPALWADYVRAAVIRAHERKAAAVWAKRDVQFQGRRICLDPIRAHLGVTRSSRRRRGHDPLGSGIARSLVCGAIWPNARVHAIDPQACALCPRCKAAVDTVHHRLWWCPEAEEERQTLVPRRLIEAARRAGPDSLFHSTGVMPHPADVWPAPVENPEVVVERLDGSAPSGEVHQFQGNFYFDGSCSTHVIPELRRAGWAIVVKDAEGKPIARISSPLWRSLPQTPQAAECVAYAAAVQFVAGASVFYGDCANVVRQAGAAPRKVCAPTARYSGVMRDTQRVPERLGHVVEFRKIKAHVDPNAIEDPEQRSHAQGNAEADLLAKDAARRHPAQSPAEEAMLATDMEDAVHIIKLASAVLRHWPPQEKTPKPKRAGAGPGAPRKEGRAHVWEFVDSAWRCRACLRCAVGAKDNPRVTRGFCTGGAAAGKSREAEGGGHTLGYARGEGMPIMFCISVAVGPPDVREASRGHARASPRRRGGRP